MLALVNYGLAKQIGKAIIKVWSTFSKVVGVGKANKYFPFMQSKKKASKSIKLPLAFLPCILLK